MIYFQDDIFGYDKRWLEEFARRWKDEVGVAFHCQIRLELTRHDAGDKRLDLFKQAGCTGITLAIESGNAFLRDRVLFRHMPDELIVEGCKKITDRGMSLRTEQILAVPFSDTRTDLSTLDLNNRINPSMAWTSILAPYGGTDMGTIASNFGFYTGNNDDLSDTFFDSTILRHAAGGPRDIEPIVRKLGVHPSARPHEQPLVNMRAVKNGDATAKVFYKDDAVGTIEYLDEQENARYSRDVVRLQRLFNWLSKVPDAESLGRKLVTVPDRDWSWYEIGRIAGDHLQSKGCPVEVWEQSLAHGMGFESAGQLPAPVRANPWYFCYMPAGEKLACSMVEKGVFDSAHEFGYALDQIGTLTRRHLFHYELYRLEGAKKPIAA
jgi:hypothetical protein